MALLAGGFQDTLNELTQGYFDNIRQSRTADEFLANAGDEVRSYIFRDMIKTLQRDIIKASNLYNYLSFWDEPAGTGGIVRNLSIRPARVYDPVNFTTGGNGRDLEFRMPDVRATYHDLKVRVENKQTVTESQLLEAVQQLSDLPLFTAGILQALASGMNDAMYQMYKQLFYKAYGELPSGTKAELTVTTLPTEITNEDEAIAAVNGIRNYVSAFKFGKGVFNEQEFPHMVPPESQVLYVQYEWANKMVDYLQLGHYMGDVNYSDILGSLKTFLGIGRVVDLDDFGGIQAFGTPTTPGDPTTSPVLFPMYDPDGAMLQTYSATKGGTSAVQVDHYGIDPTYNVRAVLAEDDWARVRITRDAMNSFVGGDSGGYTNVMRYTERLLLANPNSNSIYFADKGTTTVGP